MKFEYSGRHIEVTKPLRSHVESHFDKLKHLFDGQASKAHVIIEVEKGKHRAEIVVKWRDQVLTATTTVSDMYQALTKSIDKLEKQALKLKNKVIDKHQRPKKSSKMIPAPDEVKPEATAPRVIQTRNYSIKPMTAEEAVLELDNQENQFLVFRNAENKERVSILYRRKDKNFGLIQP